MNNTFRWVYKIVNSDDVFDIKEGEWITALPASKICQWFENLGWKVVYLNRVCQVWAVENYRVPLDALGQEVRAMSYASA